MDEPSARPTLSSEIREQNVEHGFYNLPIDFLSGVLEKICNEEIEKNTKLRVRKNQRPKHPSICGNEENVECTFKNARLACRQLYHASKRVVVPIEVRFMSGMAKWMNHLSYKHEITRQCPCPFSLPRLKFHFVAESKKALLSVSRQEPIFASFTLLYREDHATPFFLMLLSLQCQYVWVKILDFVPMRHVYPRTTCMGLSMKRAPPVIETDILVVNVAKKHLSWSPDDEAVLPDHVPQHARLVLTQGTRLEFNEPPAFSKSYDLAHRNKLPKLSATPKAMQRNYAPLSGVTTIHLEYITVGNVKSLLHVFPKLKKVCFGARVGQKAVLINALEKQGIHTADRPVNLT